jgi:hypothetical protein
VLGFCELSATELNDHNKLGLLSRQFADLPFADRLDIACHTMNSGHGSENDSTLALEMNQFSKSQADAYFQYAWKALLCDAETLKYPAANKSYFSQVISAYLSGVLENLILDYGRSNILIDEGAWQLRMAVARSGTGEYLLRIAFESKRPNLAPNLADSFDRDLWEHNSNNRFHLNFQQISQTIAGEDALQRIAEAGSEALANTLIASESTGKKVKWSIEMPEVSEFDKKFVLARSKTISTYLDKSDFFLRLRFAL